MVNYTYFETVTINIITIKEIIIIVIIINFKNLNLFNINHK